MSGGRLTNAQGKFLRALCYHKGTIEEVAKECGSPMHTVEKWLGLPTFRRHLRKRVKGMIRLRELDVTRGAMEGSRRLSRAAFGVGDFSKKNLHERRACVDLIQLARSGERERKGTAVAASSGENAVGGAASARSEREMVRAVSGEAGVAAFDALGEEGEKDE
jgi:hypothetical protein